MMSRLRRLALGTFGIVGIGLVLVLHAGSAAAQTRAALTKNVDEPGRTPYQQSQIFSPSACTFNSVLYFCRLAFPSIPNGKRLVLEHASIFVAETDSGAPDSLRFLNAFNGTALWVQPAFTPRVNTPSHFFLERDVLVYYEGGEIPTVLLAVTAPLAAAEMTVHGYLIDASN